MAARVCIVGAGPVGLSLALRLADFGIPAVIYDQNPGLKQEGSKACLIQGDVLEILDKSRCASVVHAEGVPWACSNLYIGGEPMERTRHRLDNRYGPFVNISQYRIEQIPLAELMRRPQLSVEWSSRVVALEQKEGGVAVEIEREGQRVRREYAYVVACNGQRSNLRDLVGATWLGYRHSAQFLITDIKARLPWAKERHFHFDPPFNRGYQVIIHPQPDDVWRIDWQLPPGVDVEQERRDGGLERRIRAVIGEVDYTLEWLSAYRFQQRRVERMLHGRVLFAGDAAHALPPYGSRGMNSGIQDADNLAWKLALVMQGVADPLLLDTYHVERSAAAKENIEVTEKTLRFMVPSGPVARLRRRLLLALARRHRYFLRHVNHGTMARPHRYVESPLVQAPVTAPVVGCFAADVALQMEGRRLQLRELLGRGFCFVYVGRQPPRALPARLEAFGTLATAALVLSVDGPAPLPRSMLPGLQWARADAAALAHYLPDHWHLVRPDMHVAGVYDFERPEQFDDALCDFLVAAYQTSEPLWLAA